MVSDRFKILVGKVKKRISELKPEDIAKFTIKEAAGSIPVIGQYITDAIEEFSPDEKFELLQELKLLAETQFAEISTEIGVSIEYLKDIKTFTYNEFKIQKADHEEIKGLLLRLMANQTKINIREQKAEVIYNAAGDIIIYNYAKEPVNIPCIQSVLKKGETEKGGFFKTPPEWVDFEQGYIFEREQVNDILNKFDKDIIQLVLGAPASGKSIVLKNVGYRLAMIKKNVYMIELKKHLEEDIKSFFDKIPTIDNAIFIVDDAHLYLSYCEKLVKEFKKSGRGNLIIGSRDSKEITKKHPTEGFEYPSLNELRKTCIEIKAEDVNEEIIKTFLEKQNSDSDRINAALKNLGDYKEDLWFLSWALMSYNNSVNMDDIYNKIRNYIEEIKIGQEKEPIYINAEEVFLPLSIFYRYEIPIERDFLEAELDINGKLISQLIKLQKIAETKETKMLSLYHSSLAELYLRAYKKYDAFGKRIKKKILNGKKEEDLEYCSFYRYITKCPINSIDIVNILGDDEKDGRTLLKKLIEKEEIQKAFENGINKEEDIRKVGSCVAYFGLNSEEIGLKLMNGLDMDALSAKINKEEDLLKVAWCLDDISLNYSEVTLKLIDGLDMNALSAKINKEEHIEKIGWLLRTINPKRKETALKLMNSLDMNALSAKIDKEEDIEKVEQCISFIRWISLNFTVRLVYSINIDALSAKINKEENIEKVISFLSEMNLAAKVVQKLIDIDILTSKIDKEEDIEKIGSWISATDWVNNETALKIVNGLDIDALSAKINKEEDIGKIRPIISKFARANKEVALKLADSGVSEKINKEDDLVKVVKFVNDIAGVSKEVARKLVDNIDINALSLKLDKEEDIEKAVSYVSSVAGVSKETALKLVNSLDMDALSVKINKEKDIGKIGWCVSGIADSSKETARKLVDSIDMDNLSDRIYEEEDIQYIGWFISIIADSNNETAWKLVDSIDIDAMSSKIDDEEDALNIGSCISNIAAVSKEVALKLVNSLDIDALSTKIDNEKEDIDIEEWISDIAEANKEVALKLVNRLNSKLRGKLQIKIS